MKTNIVLLTLVLLGLVSCADKSERVIQGIPFQETKDGKWSMISMEDGQVLFSEEFKEAPTVAIEGRFMVKNKEGLWEIYTAEKKPKKVGKEYVSATRFFEGHALVVERNKPVSIIDKEGQTLKVLDKIDGKTVTKVASFSEGYAVYRTDKYFGVIDTDGKNVIPANYCYISSCSDGKFIAIDKKYEQEVEKGEKEKVKIYVLDTKGKKLFEFSGGKYDDISEPGFQDGYSGVAIKKDDKKCWGIINDKGEEVVKPSEKIEEVGTIHGDKFIYKKEDEYGLMNMKGEVLIRAKYDVLYFDGDNLWAGQKVDGKELNFKYKYINEKDEEIFKEDYKEAFRFDLFGDKYTVVKESDTQYTLIDKKGKSLEKLPDMVNINFSMGDDWVESDFVDLNELVGALGITPNGIDKLSFNSTIQQVVAQYAKEENAGTSEHPGTDPYWYDSKRELSYDKAFISIPVKIEIGFPDNISRQTYRTEREYYEYFYYDQRVPTGYAFNNINPSYFAFGIGNSGKMKGKMKDLFSKVCAKFKQMGTVVRENNGAAIIAINNGCTALILKRKTSVSAIWGKNEGLKNFDISKYANISEDTTSENYSSDVDTDISDATDSDSVVAIE